MTNEKHVAGRRFPNVSARTVMYVFYLLLTEKTFPHFGNFVDFRPGVILMFRIAQVNFE